MARDLEALADRLTVGTDYNKRPAIFLYRDHGPLLIATFPREDEAWGVVSLILEYTDRGMTEETAIDAALTTYRELQAGEDEAQRHAAYALDAVTSNPERLAIHAYRERRDFHYKTRKIEDLQRDLDRARKEYGRVVTESTIAYFRSDDTAPVPPAYTAAHAALRAAVLAYDAAHDAMTAVIGAWPKTSDNYYPRY